MELVKVKLSDGSEVYVEIQTPGGYQERGTAKKIYEISDDYLKVASDMIEKIKSIKLAPTCVELEFGIALKVASSGLLAWIATEANADANILVKMKWEKDS